MPIAFRPRSAPEKSGPPPPQEAIDKFQGGISYNLSKYFVYAYSIFYRKMILNVVKTML